MAMRKRALIEWDRELTEQEKAERRAGGAISYDLCVIQERIEVMVSAVGITLPDGSVIGGMAALKARFPGATIRSI